jgi:DNA-binding protein H-NS
METSLVACMAGEFYAWLIGATSNRHPEENTMAAQINLKKMSVDKLIDLRSQVDAALSAKAAEQRRILESELSKLDDIVGPSKGAKNSGRSGARGTVPPKFRNPDVAGETWAGRGLQPRWLSAAIKAGAKLEDFRIGTVPETERRPKGAAGARRAERKAS